MCFTSFWVIILEARIKKLRDMKEAFEEQQDDDKTKNDGEINQKPKNNNNQVSNGVVDLAPIPEAKPSLKKRLDGTFRSFAFFCKKQELSEDNIENYEKIGDGIIYGISMLIFVIITGVVLGLFFNSPDTPEQPSD